MALPLPPGPPSDSFLLWKRNNWNGMRRSGPGRTRDGWPHQAMNFLLLLFRTRRPNDGHKPSNNRPSKQQIHKRNGIGVFLLSFLFRNDNWREIDDDPTDKNKELQKEGTKIVKHDFRIDPIDIKGVTHVLMF